MADELDGLKDAYRAPIEDHDYAPADANGSDAFYVVSPTKLVILFMSTLGVYALYWFYKHWDNQRRTHGLDAWPVLRAIFAVFFTHRLFRAIDQTARAAGFSPAWEPNGQATIYVVLLIGTRVLTRLDAFAGAGVMMGVLSAGLSLAAVVPLLSAQRVANLVAGDPEGSRNSSITALNAGFMVVGVLMWGLTIAVLFAAEDGSMEGW
jgi:hypothetical protein